MLKKIFTLIFHQKSVNLLTFKRKKVEKSLHHRYSMVLVQHF